MGGRPLIEPYGWYGDWEAARRILDNADQLHYSSTDVTQMEKVAFAWLREIGDLATSDIMELCGVSRGRQISASKSCWQMVPF